MNVILVDDERIALSALERRVDWKKYGVTEVFTAMSMKKAKEIFLSHPIDVMLSDIEMPQGNGLELFEWVKLHYPEVECVYVSCHADYEYMRKALLLGSADYILKPIDYAELDAVLTQLTGRVRARPVRSKPVPTPEEPEEEPGTEKSADIVDAVKRYVREHIREDIYIADIAGTVFLNERHLMRLFKKATGTSILEYITGERLQFAQKLLISTEHPVSVISDLVGYRNYSYFIKIFKRETGWTPQAYRTEARKGM